MNKIPLELRDELSKNPLWRYCSLADRNCRGKIQWHHNFQYANKQIQERFSIISLCEYHHKMARSKEFRDLIDWICLSRAVPEDLAKYPKINWAQKIRFLRKKYKGLDREQKPS